MRRNAKGMLHTQHTSPEYRIDSSVPSKVYENRTHPYPYPDSAARRTPLSTFRTPLLDKTELLSLPILFVPVLPVCLLYVGNFLYQ